MNMQKALLASIVILYCLPAMALDAVTLQLKWKHQYQFAGYYAAQQMGYYEDAGFEVTISEVDFSSSPLDAVLEGKAEFAVADSGLVLNRLHGNPVIILGAIFQNSPLVMLTRSDDQVKTVQDLRGKRLMFQEGAADASIVAMLHQEGLVRGEDYEFVKHNFHDEMLKFKEVDAMSAYATYQDYLYEQMGLKVSIMDPRAYGINFYGDILFSSEDVIKRDPERVQRFLEASLKGWEYALANPEQVNEWILTVYAAEKEPELLSYEAKQTKLYINPDNVELGHVTQERLEEIASVYKKIGLVDNDVALDVMTLKGFLEKNKSTFNVLAWAPFIAFGLFLLIVILIYLKRKSKAA